MGALANVTQLLEPDCLAPAAAKGAGNIGTQVKALGERVVLTQPWSAESHAKDSRWHTNLGKGTERASLTTKNAEVAQIGGLEPRRLVCTRRGQQERGRTEAGQQSELKGSVQRQGRMPRKSEVNCSTHLSQRRRRKSLEAAQPETGPRETVRLASKAQRQVSAQRQGRTPREFEVNNSTLAARVGGLALKRLENEKLGLHGATQELRLASKARFARRSEKAQSKGRLPQSPR